MTNQMFEEVQQGGIDIAAFNLQRGRDHGIPPLNQWREHCGLGKLTSFNQPIGVMLEEFRERYSDVYE